MLLLKYTLIIVISVNLNVAWCRMNALFVVYFLHTARLLMLNDCSQMLGVTQTSVGLIQ